jgi:hypothetical protein
MRRIPTETSMMFHMADAGLLIVSIFISPSSL